MKLATDRQKQQQTEKWERTEPKHVRIVTFLEKKCQSKIPDCVVLDERDVGMLTGQTVSSTIET
jgi:hypothetical protein